MRLVPTLGLLSVCALTACSEQSTSTAPLRVPTVQSSLISDGVETPGLVADSRVAAVSTGRYHTCGLSVTGVTRCWGSNDFGQLGDGTTEERPAPVTLASGPSFIRLSAGGYFTCGLTLFGHAFCWGYNRFGALGDGTEIDHSTPAAVATQTQFVSLSAGTFHACGLGRDGTAYCWGGNDNGQLGNGTTDASPTPIPVSGGFHFVEITAGDSHTCGRTLLGKAYCWGNNGNGQGGNGAAGTQSIAPVAVVGDLRFAGLSAGASHTCGWTITGAAYCWGFDGYGQLGDGGSDEKVPTPVPVSGGLRFIEVSAGAFHTCARTPGGSAYCWGKNDGGNLGDGTQANSVVPVEVLGGLNFTDLTSGNSHTCAIAIAAKAYCWGANDVGQLGDGTTIYRDVPMRVLW